jgi:competence protein ComFC
MSPVKLSPVRIHGPWNDGYALDRHTISSTPTGDPYRWDTKRTELGQLVYELKYGNNPGALQSIVETAEDFVRNHWEGLPELDCIVPAPPSVSARGLQPVVAIARALATRLGIGVCENAVAKIAVTPQMKNMSDWAQRRQTLREAIQKGAANVEGKQILILDDLTESRSTLGRVTDVLRSAGASEVYALALTRTK